MTFGLNNEHDNFHRDIDIVKLKSKSALFKDRYQGPLLKIEEFSTNRE